MGYGHTVRGYYGPGVSGGRISFEESLMFTTLPSGPLTVRISYPAIMGDTVTHNGSWSSEDKNRFYCNASRSFISTVN